MTPSWPTSVNRLESYVVRQTADLVDDLGDEERKELAEVLHELEGFSPRAAEAETRMEELVEKLESRTILVEKSRARIEELERELAQAKAINDDRQERFAAEIETERIHAAQREQNFRAELESREAELRRRIEGVEGRERELAHSDRLLAERGRTLSLRESEVENRAQELKARSDEALSEREQELAKREAELDQLERTAANEKQLLERRSIHAAERERRTELQLSRIEEREEKLAEEATAVSSSWQRSSRSARSSSSAGSASSSRTSPASRAHFLLTAWLPPTARGRYARFHGHPGRSHVARCDHDRALRHHWPRGRENGGRGRERDRGLGRRPPDRDRHRA